MLNNDSSDGIEITKILKSCNCTETRISSNYVQPGEKIELTAIVDIADTRPLGDFVSNVSVEWKSSNGNISGATHLSIKGRIVSLVGLSHTFIDFEEINARNPAPTRILTIRKGEADLRWDSIKVSTDEPDLLVAAKKVAEETFEVSITPKPQENPIGEYQRNLFIEILDGPGLVKRIALPVRAKFVGPVKVTPPSLFFGVVKPNSVKEGSFTLESSDSDLKLLSVNKSGIENISISQHFEGGKKIIFSYKALMDGIRTKNSKLIVVTQTAQGQNKISIPIIALIKE